MDAVEGTVVGNIPMAGLVMAAYNATPYLEKAVEGILNQEFSDFVCRIVDDGSTDGTADMARDLTSRDHRFVVDTIDHGGQSVARNVGVSRLPETRYVSFPDADDVWRKDALGALIGAAEEFDGVGAHALATTIDMHGNAFDRGDFTQYGRDRMMFRMLRRQRLPVERPSNFDSLLCSCTVYPPGVWALRRDVFDRVGGFDPQIHLFEDWDLQIRASRLGELAFLDKIVVNYRRHPTQVSSSLSSVDAIAALRDKTVKSPLNSNTQRRAAAIIWRANELRNALRSARMTVRHPGRAGREARNAAVHFIRSLVGPRLVR